MKRHKADKDKVEKTKGGKISEDGMSIIQLASTFHHGVISYFVILQKLNILPTTKRNTAVQPSLLAVWLWEMLDQVPALTLACRVKIEHYQQQQQYSIETIVLYTHPQNVAHAVHVTFTLESAIFHTYHCRSIMSIFFLMPLIIQSPYVHAFYVHKHVCCCKKSFGDSKLKFIMIQVH